MARPLKPFDELSPRGERARLALADPDPAERRRALARERQRRYRYRRDRRRALARERQRRYRYRRDRRRARVVPAEVLDDTLIDLAELGWISVADLDDPDHLKVALARIWVRVAKEKRYA